MEVPEEKKIQLMAYMDGEMDPEQRSEFERFLLKSPELQNQLAQYQKLQSILGRVRIPEPKIELWDEYPRKNFEKSLRFAGWLLFVIGALIVAISSEYLFWKSSEIPFIIKIGITLLILGLGILLGSVIIRRRKEGKTDRYKEIIR